MQLNPACYVAYGESWMDSWSEREGLVKNFKEFVSSFGCWAHSLNTRKLDPNRTRRCSSAK
jgi:hypothetical protein